MENDLIWEQFNIKNIKLQNRIVRSATNEHLATLDGVITKSYIDLYQKLALSGIGLIITSHMAVEKNQRADLTHVCIREKENLEGLKKLTDEVHKTNSKIVSQISYGGSRATKVVGKQAMSVSETKDTTKMTISDINRCIDHYVEAVYLAEKLGFDGVELHLAHGYLLSEFLDPLYNKRTDEYGGVVENRYRIIHQILSNIKQIILNPDFLVMVKINATSKSEDPSFLNDQIKVCELLEEDGVDTIEISGSNYKKYREAFPYFLDHALKIKEKVSVPIMLVGGFRNKDDMNRVIDQGIDLVSMSRPFIADKTFIEKLKDNQISKCVSCNQCFNIYKREFKHCIFDDQVNKQLYKNFHK